MAHNHSVLTRPMGKNGPQVPALGYGCMNLSAYYTTNSAPDEERFKVLDHAAKLGATF
jgi:aryl-alcohol dehydrogenase-like predicted oxidoreductase